MAKKKYDDFDTMDDIADNVGDLSRFDNYEKFDVDAKVKDLTIKTKNFLLQVAKTHLSTSMDSNEDYVKSICDAESTNLLFLMKQVKYSEHVLDSLMRQLDNGGYMEPSIFDTIRVMQKSGVELTLEVSKYLRTLPEYFKFLEKELNAKTQEAIAIERHATEDVTDDAEVIESSDELFNMSGPIMGTR